MNQAPTHPLRNDLRVGNIASPAVIFDIHAQGVEIARYFENAPESPGVIISKEGKFHGAISHHDFMHTIGRQYGIELFYRRPINAVLEICDSKPFMILPADCPVHEAVQRCLAREQNEMFTPFLVEERDSGMVKMVDFRALMMASSDLFACRNRQLAEEMEMRELLERKLLRSQRMEVVGLLVGGIAHNLNNTLGPIMMAASMLNRQLSEETHGDFVKTIEDGVQRAADIIGQLLVFSRGKDGKFQTLESRRLVEEVGKFIEMTFPKCISFRQNLPEGLSNIVGDQTQLHQVLLNLCINARDAMPFGGVLTISGENCRVNHGCEGVHAEVRPGNYVKLKVTDTGCGIPPENVDKIFDPFFTTKEIGKGTGLGLSTAIGIVRSHHGFMKVTSEIGRGTSFSLLFPATEAPVQVGGGVQPDASFPRGNGELILVVDDEALICKTAEHILRENGYQVLTASSGPAALTAYGERSREIRLVLTDIAMPVMDGVELTRTLRQTEPGIKIIVSSGKIDESQEVALNGMGIRHWLWKPYRSEQLLKMMHAAIRGESVPPGVPGPLAA
ncbi:MAG: ATP-binding protein [Chthoniobacteraceae bacterium]